MKKIFGLLALVVFGMVHLFAQQDTKALIVMIKTNLAQSKVSLKQYEWIETTTAYYKGELKSTKQEQCYYGVDGTLTRVETGGSTPAPEKKGGIRGKIIENKVDDIKAYIEQAVAKVHTYLPPDGTKLQQIYAAGSVAIHIIKPGTVFQLDFPNYNEQGDLLSVTIDKEQQKLVALAVNTYIDDPAQKVVFNITYKSLPDGTQFAETTSLDATAKEVKIVITNSGYKKAAGN